MTAKSSAFSLIELMVVVAIIGILATVGVVTYSGYVTLTKKKSAENIMQQLSLAQTEYYTNNATYAENTSTTCSMAALKGELKSDPQNLGNGVELQNLLFEGSFNIIDTSGTAHKAISGYNFCAESTTSTYKISGTDGKCEMTLNQKGIWTRNNC